MIGSDTSGLVGFAVGATLGDVDGDEERLKKVGLELGESDGWSDEVSDG